MSFKNLKTINGIVLSPFHEAALSYGLLKYDNYLTLCLDEASTYQMPFTLCRLFATLLAFCEPNDPKMLWDKFEKAMS